ncbi:MAG: sporulation protein YqfD [Clostridia bacterium]|nr:sporulation protein YqfD [Clostridia bacterium]
MYLLWSWIRWLLGYVELDVSGAYGERFLTQCMQRQIEVWKIRRSCPGIIRLCSYRFSFPHLEESARKCGVSLENIREIGLPSLFKRYRLRVGMFLGMGIYLLLMAFLPQFVWSVEIPDADPVRATRIRRVLAEEGFGVGSYVPNVDFLGLRYSLMLAEEEISFVSVNMQGSRAVVEVRFTQPVLPLEEKTPCNLVASRDGQILSVYVKNGVRYVNKGQTVQKGDLLVGGLVDTRLGYYAVHSDGEILARVTDVVSRTEPLVQRIEQRTGRVKVHYIWNFFGKEFSLQGNFTCPYEQYDTVTEKKYLSFGENGSVPVSVTEIYYYETVPSEKKITPEEAEFFARRKLDEDDRLRLCGVEVETQKESVTVSETEVTVTRTRSLILDIGEKKPFYFEDKG